MPGSSVFKDNLFEGKKVFVTGGATGMGFGFAKAFLEHGADVIIASRKEENLLKATADMMNQTGKTLLWKTMDVRNTETVEEVVSHIEDTWGHLDVLVNNAGTNIPEPFLNVKKSSMETLLNVNTKAVFNVAQLCANQIIKLKRKSGSIINISSIFGLVAGQKRTVYSMTKFGVEGLTKGMALDLAKYNIRVNSVCPNIVLTPRTKKYFADKKYNKYVKDNTPINKVVTVSDVATSITFLASEAASMITGTSIVIDGGWTAK